VRPCLKNILNKKDRRGKGKEEGEKKGGEYDQILYMHASKCSNETLYFAKLIYTNKPYYLISIGYR
jgi:hypothetical protein